MAIDEIYDDHEQSERVRDWLRRNAVGLAAGIGLGLALIWGWNWWQDHQQGQRVETGSRYQAVVSTIAAGDLELASAHAAVLPDGSAYEVLAALDLAKAQFEAGDAEAAIASLRAADSSDVALEPVRRHRLALLLLETGQSEEVVSLLANTTEPASMALLGDALLALDRSDEARQSYASAIAAFPEGAPERSLIELKLIGAGGEPAQPGAI